MLYICTRNQQMNGALVQLVRIRACHARGQGFESPTHRKSRQTATFVFLAYWSKLWITEKFRITVKFRWGCEKFRWRRKKKWITASLRLYPL